MAKETTDALVLDIMDFRETSCFITAYTEKFGKITLISKGMRKPNSPLTGKLEPFTRGILHFYLHENRTIYLLSEFTPAIYPQTIRNSYDRIVSSFLVSEITRKITMEFHSHPRFFQLLVQTIQLLNDEKIHALQDLIRIFEIKSIALHGYQPNLQSCNLCGAQTDELRYFSARHGGSICKKCGTAIKGKLSMSRGTLTFMEKALHIPDHKIGSLTASKTINRELKKITHAVFQYYFEREFNSLKLLP